MGKFDRKKHWENIYRTKQFNEVSWFQPIPKISLDFIRQFNVSTTAKIIDVGGGDSLFVDHLLDLDYKDITVLDISESAIERAKLRLGDRANKVKWIVADAATFKPDEKYDFWHDRATFHFLTREKEISGYLVNAKKSIKQNGIIVIGTFSEDGPGKCSGIDIRQYTETTMTDRLKLFFEKIKCITIDHITPSGSVQNFIFCIFKYIK